MVLQEYQGCASRVQLQLKLSGVLCFTVQPVNLRTDWLLPLLPGRIHSATYNKTSVSRKTDAARIACYEGLLSSFTPVRVLRDLELFNDIFQKKLTAGCMGLIVIVFLNVFISKQLTSRQCAFAQSQKTSRGGVRKGNPRGSPIDYCISLYLNVSFI